jgi:hypothetical protein
MMALRCGYFIYPEVPVNKQIIRSRICPQAEENKIELSSIRPSKYDLHVLTMKCNITVHFEQGICSLKQDFCFLEAMAFSRRFEAFESAVHR